MLRLPHNWQQWYCCNCLIQERKHISNSNGDDDANICMKKENNDNKDDSSDDDNLYDNIDVIMTSDYSIISNKDKHINDIDGNQNLYHSILSYALQWLQ